MYDPTFTTGGRATYRIRTKSGSGNMGQTLADIIKDLNDQFDALLNDTDIARMCSDILKAFGDNGIQVLEPVPEVFEIEPINDEVRKLQLHNTVFSGIVAGGNFSPAINTALGTVTDSSQTLCVYQEGGVMKQELFTAGRTNDDVAISGSSFSLLNKTSDFSGKYVPSTVFYAKTIMVGDPFINTWKDEVSREDIVEMTRQTLAFNRHISTDSTFMSTIELDGYSTYVVMSFTVYSNEFKSVTGYKVGGYGTNIIGYQSQAAAESVLGIFAYFSQVDWHPYFATGNDTNQVATYAVYYDLDNYTIIPKSALRRIHEACTMSLYKLELTASPSHE
jgi:hypothetical protein